MKYTREQILAMDAAQLRLAIAEVKGWRFPREFVEFCSVVSKGDDTRNEYYSALTGERILYKDDGDGDPPNWSTEISAAWELLTEIIGWQMWHNGHRYKVLTPHNLSASGDTAPLAICRAYLLWKEGV